MPERDSMPLAALSFLAGALIVGGGVFYFMLRISEESFALAAQRDCAAAQTRAMQAYLHEGPAVAIWELRQLADLQNESVRLEADSDRSRNWQLTEDDGARYHRAQGNGPPCLGFYSSSASSVVGCGRLLMASEPRVSLGKCRRRQRT